MAEASVESTLEKINNYLVRALEQLEQITGEHPDLPELAAKLDGFLEEFTDIADEM